MSLIIYITLFCIFISIVLINMSYYITIKKELMGCEDMEKALLFANLPEDCWILVVAEYVSELRERRR